jgi:protein ImuB
VWFPRLPSDRALRLRPVEGAFALTLRTGNAERLHCLNMAAESLGLQRGMGLADARASCPDLVSAPADPVAEARFLALLRRWATRWCPWVASDPPDGLVLDITGAAHLWRGEEALAESLRADLTRMGLGACIGLADTRGAAWGLARHGRELGGGLAIAPPGAGLAAIGPLPVAALRLPADTVIGLQRLGLRRVADIATTPRAPLARRFGADVTLRLDQALGQIGEPVTPEAEPAPLSVRLTLPEPIGLQADLRAGADRLLAALCARLKGRDLGARVLRLTLRRVDQASQQLDLRLAAPLRDPARILPLFDRGFESVEAGFGIDQLRLEVLQAEPLPAQQVALGGPAPQDGLEDLITRIGARIGLENVQRFLPADSHIPERAFSLAPAAYSRAESGWSAPRPRPVVLFAPEPIDAIGSAPPRRFRWRRMALEVLRATGPERIAPEWWLPPAGWDRGLRDYWAVQTRQGRRLWLFHTPQNPGWFVQGEFA